MKEIYIIMIIKNGLRIGKETITLMMDPMMTPMIAPMMEEEVEEEEVEEEETGMGLKLLHMRWVK